MTTSQEQLGRQVNTTVRTMTTSQEQLGRQVDRLMQGLGTVDFEALNVRAAHQRSMMPASVVNLEGGPTALAAVKE